jgi:hypothetical protein
MLTEPVTSIVIVLLLYSRTENEAYMTNWSGVLFDHMWRRLEIERVAQYFVLSTACTSLTSADADMSPCRLVWCSYGVCLEFGLSDA